MGLQQVFNVLDYGARGDWNGSTGTDDTAAIQAAIDAAPARSATIFFPGNRLYKITNSLNIIDNAAGGNKKGLRLVGENGGSAGGVSNAGLVWDGASTTTPMMKMYSRENTVENLNFFVASGRTAKCAIDIDQEPNHVNVPTDNTFINLGFFPLTHGGVMTNGVDIGATAAGNGDFMRFYRCHWNLLANAGVRILFSQAKQIIFSDCIFNGGPIGIYQLAGSFHMIGGYLNSHTSASIVLTQSTDHLLLVGIGSENSSRLLDTSVGGSSSYWPVSILGGRFALNGLHADKEYIKFTWGGPLTIDGGQFSGDSAMKISANAAAPGSHLIVRGCSFDTTTPIKTTDTMNLVMHGNMSLVAGVRTTLPDFSGNLGAATGGARQVLVPLGFGTSNYTTLPVGTDGSGTGITVNATADVRRITYKVTVDRTALSAAALTADKTFYTLAAKQKLVAVYADVTTPFTGGGVTAATMVVGKTAGGNEYLVSFDVFTAGIMRGLADADLGTSLNRANAIQGGDLPSWTTTTAIRCRLTTVTANTNALTAGSVTFYLVTEMM